MGPDNSVVPDVLGKLPGRGIWVAADRAALDKAVQKGLFSRSAKQSVQVPETLVDEIERQLTKRVIEGIAMARKAGRAVAGYEKVKSWLDKGEAKVLIQAIDGSGRGKSKLSTPENGKFIGCLTANELGLAFGRDHVIHSALGPGGLSKRVIEDATRLKGLRENGGGPTAGKG
ncbi:putative nucleic-acid-binding protein [Candidatus Rhodobacter oscarellae]|uniref:Putative nucleic-acid-binding protein n=1 Tax=Candidatus Rhodobacter oscarellae TaxID=1675527 RepID=A0A0J9E8B2_9RHOB|nr:putative nucleic-acid-binding protein [Candidatus Rhodobacter lobularis]